MHSILLGAKKKNVLRRNSERKVNSRKDSGERWFPKGNAENPEGEPRTSNDLSAGCSGMEEAAWRTSWGKGKAGTEKNSIKVWPQKGTSNY